MQKHLDETAVCRVCSGHLKVVEEKTFRPGLDTKLYFKCQNKDFMIELWVSQLQKNVEKCIKYNINRQGFEKTSCNKKLYAAHTQSLLRQNLLTFLTPTYLMQSKV